MSYPSDLTYSQWQVLEPVLLKMRSAKGGRPVRHGMRRVIDAILYVLKTGCQWRQLPTEYGPWMTIYSHFRRMRLRGTWDMLLNVLREQARYRLGRHLQPSVAIVDSQSVKTTSKGGSAVTTRARKSKAVSDTSRLTRKATSSP